MVLESRPVSASRTNLSQIMLPEDANPDANVHGGTIMKLADSAAGVAAARHCRSRVVTARIDGMDFVAPVHVGNVVTVMASVMAQERSWERYLAQKLEPLVLLIRPEPQE